MRQRAFLVCVIQTVVALYIFLDQSQQDLRFDRAAIFSGEVWRAFTAPYAHISAAHLFYNFGGLIAMVLVFPRVLNASALLTVTAITIVITALALMFLPGTSEWYLGYSGVLHAMLSFAAIRSAKENKWYWLLPLILIVKVVTEFTGTRTGEDAWGLPVAADVHACGLLVGCALALIRKQAMPLR